MIDPTKDEQLSRLASKYIWWTAPEITVSEGLDRLVANVMEMGTWDDATCLLELVGADVFFNILRSPPAGVISSKSLAFWHYRLGGKGLPPKSRGRFD